MNLKAVAGLIVAAVSALACTAATDPEAAVRERLDSLRVDPVEGIWSMNPNGGGATFAVLARPGEPGAFEMILLESPDWRIAPGTPCGSVDATSKSGVYECRLLASPGSTKGSGLAKYTATLRLDDQGRRLVVRPFTKRTYINLRRWVPYLFRVSIDKENTRPDDIEGAVRVYPPAPGIYPVEL